MFKTPACEMKWAMYFDEWDLNWKDFFLVSFWQNIQTHILKSSVHLYMRNVILGLFDIENSKFNFVILHAKYFIL